MSTGDIDIGPICLQCGYVVQRCKCSTACEITVSGNTEMLDLPCCDKWTEGIKAVNGPITLQSLRSGFLYEFPKEFDFAYCPWCGKKLNANLC